MTSEDDQDLIIRVGRLESALAQNTAVTEGTAKKVELLLDLFSHAKFVVKLVKWLSAVAMFMISAWYFITNFGPAPK